MDYQLCVQLFDIQLKNLINLAHKYILYAEVCTLIVSEDL